MKKKSTKYFCLEDGVYNAVVYLGINVSHKQFVAYLTKRLGSKVNWEWQGDTRAETVVISRDNLHCFCIWSQEFNWTVNDQSTLAHEIFHLVVRILDSRGVVFEVNNHEAWAYYYGYWLDKIWNELKVVYT